MSTLEARQQNKTHRARPRPPFQQIALVLQGGGALGAYQAGVYEALAEADLHPDWVAGISIGAINTALIAGNAPQARVDKLKEFWESVTTPFWQGAERNADQHSSECGRGPQLHESDQCRVCALPRVHRLFSRRVSPCLGWRRRERLPRRATTTRLRCVKRWSGWWISIGSMPTRCGSASVR